MPTTATSALPHRGHNTAHSNMANKIAGESHRVYWQQWLKSSSANSHELAQGRRELITSSAAIRISANTAKARDVTRLLRKTLNLSAFAGKPKDEDYDDGDSLVLVGTLYSIPRNYVQFEHQIAIRNAQQYDAHPDHQNPLAAAATPNSSSSGGSTSNSTAVNVEPFHVVKTLNPTDNPLHVRDIMVKHLEKLQKDIVGTGIKHPRNGTISSPATSPLRSSPPRPVIAPKLQWYYVPGHQSTPPTSPLPSCIDLDGYCTSLEDEECDDDSDCSSYDDDHQQTHTSLWSQNVEEKKQDDGYNGYDNNDFLENDPGYFSLLTKYNNQTLQATTVASDDADSQHRRLRRQRRRELRRYVQLSQCQVAGDVPADDDRIYRAQLNDWPQTNASAADFNNPNSCFDPMSSESPLTTWTGSGGNMRLSGYLLHQSHSDPHVWRRVHCVLTENHFWFVTRTVNMFEDTDMDEPVPSLALARSHGRIALNEALLFEPSPPKKNGASHILPSNAPLHKIPHAFEIETTSKRDTRRRRATPKGMVSTTVSHVFRAPNRRTQQQWIYSLQSRIRQMQDEDSFLSHAELIVSEETLVRNQRRFRLAIQPMISSVVGHRDKSRTDHDTTVRNNPGANVIDAPLLPIQETVLRWGLCVSEFREQCRHIQAILPAKQPILAHQNNLAEIMSPTSAGSTPLADRLSSRTASGETARATRSTSQNSANAEAENPPSLPTSPTKPKDAFSFDLQAMTTTSWHFAAELLLEATGVVATIQEASKVARNDSNLRSPTLSNSMRHSGLETVCQHIDYMIMGEFRNFSGKGFVSKTFKRSKSNTSIDGDASADETADAEDPGKPGIPMHDSPPPIDLFDHLLKELQSLVAPK